MPFPFFIGLQRRIKPCQKQHFIFYVNTFLWKFARCTQKTFAISLWITTSQFPSFEKKHEELYYHSIFMMINNRDPWSKQGFWNTKKILKKRLENYAKKKNHKNHYCLSYLLKRGITWNHLKRATNYLRTPETNWKHLKPLKYINHYYSIFT